MVIIDRRLVDNLDEVAAAKTTCERLCCEAAREAATLLKPAERTKNILQY
jgi:hypothetical protein